MLQFIRGLIHSKWGAWAALGFFALIALAFGLGSVTGNSPLGSAVGGDRAATIGNAKVGTAELAQEANRELEQARQRDPKLSMKAFVAGGGFEQTAEQMFDRVAISVFGANNGIIAGKRLVDSELTKIPSLQGPDGKFNQALYQRLLGEKNLTDADVRTQIGTGLVAKQILLPAEFGADAPGEAVRRYAALLKEHRTGAVAMLPATAFAPRTPPSDAVLAAFYQHNSASFIRPERRVVRFAVFDASAVKQSATPSDAQIAAYYNANAAQYAASESRGVTSLILPDEASAKAAVASGSLDGAAHAKGLSTAKLPPLTRDGLSAQTSPEAAAAVFGAARGALVGPVKSALGWYVLHVDTVDAKPARSLAAAHAEIAASLAAKMRQSALADLTAKIDDGFGKGGALADAAKELGVKLTETEPLTADGHVYAKPGATAPAQIAKIIPTAFQMERTGAPQLAELDAGKTFVIFDVSQIATSAAAPLAEVKADVATAYALKTGTDAARVAAMKVLAETKKGTDLGKALATLGVALPPVQPVSMGRDQLAAMQGRVPPALNLFFGMAQGTTHMMPLPGNRGWIIIQLKTIQPGTVAANDPLLADTAKELGKLAGNEYADELRVAIRGNVGVKRNETAISAVKAQLGGGN